MMAISAAIMVRIHSKPTRRIRFMLTFITLPVILLVESSWMFTSTK